MKLEYDKEADAAYIYLVESIDNDEVRKSFELNENIILDYDENGKLLGFEILNASKILSEKVFLEKLAI